MIAVPSPQPRAKKAYSRLLADVAACFGAVLLGLGLRWPELWNIPVFTDEWDEIAVSIAIIRDGARPLTNSDAYYGALTSYLMAGFLGLVGISVESPRLFALVLGTLQLIPAYLFGREAGQAIGLSLRWRRLAAVLTTLLMATSAAHILLNSHLAWANSTTPLFTTTAAWLLVRACRRWRDDQQGGPELATAGFFLGLALQTHVLVAALIVGLGVGALISMPGLSLSRWGALACAYLTLGYTNMLVFNVMTGGETLRHARAMSEGYAGGKDIAYFEKLGDLLLSLLRVLGGAVSRREPDLAYLTDPILVAGILLALIGIILLARHRQVIPLCVLISVALILPLINNRYEPMFSGRYLTPLLPVLFAGVSLALVTGARRFGPRRGAVLAIGLVSVMSVYSLVQLHGLYQHLRASGRSNDKVLATLREIQSTAQPGDVVYIDNRLRRRKLMEAGAGDMERVFRSLLDVSNIPYQVIDLDRTWTPPQSGLLILASRENPGATTAVVERLRLTHPSGGPPVPFAERDVFQVYRAATLSGS